MERNRFLTGVSDESPAEFISKAFRSQLNELIYRAITKLCKIHTPRLERLASFDYKCTFSINLARHPGAPPRIIGWNGTGSAETRIEKATRNRQDAARNRYTFGSSRNKIRPSPVLAYSSFLLFQLPSPKQTAHARFLQPQMPSIFDILNSATGSFPSVDARSFCAYTSLDDCFNFAATLE